VITPGLLAMACQRVSAVWEADDPGPNNNPDNKLLIASLDGFAGIGPIYIPPAQSVNPHLSKEDNLAR